MSDSTLLIAGLLLDNKFSQPSPAHISPSKFKAMGRVHNRHVVCAWSVMEELCVKFISPKGVSSKHIIYCKRHALRKNSTKTPNDRTLFSIGWPPYCTEDIIHELFSRTSEVETVFLRNSLGNVEETEEKKVTVSFRRRDFGYIVFKTKEGLDEVLKMCKSNMTLSCPIKNTGLSALYNDYKRQRPPIRILRARAEKQVEKYDTLKDEERKRKRLLSEPDEEGWITVTKKNAVDTEMYVYNIEITQCLMDTTGIGYTRGCLLYMF